MAPDEENPFGGHAFGEVPFGPGLVPQADLVLAPNAIVLHGHYSASITLSAHYRGTVALHGRYTAIEQLAAA